MMHMRGPTSAVECHAPSATKVMLLETASVHSLLGEDIATTKEHLRID